jgi:hypothetical protein
MKFKYLEIKEKPYNKGEWVANIDVTNLNKKGIEEKIKQLETKFPIEKIRILCN